MLTTDQLQNLNIFKDTPADTGYVKITKTFREGSPTFVRLGALYSLGYENDAPLLFKEIKFADVYFFKELERNIYLTTFLRDQIFTRYDLLSKFVKKDHAALYATNGSLVSLNNESITLHEGLTLKFPHSLQAASLADFVLLYDHIRVNPAETRLLLQELSGLCNAH